MLEEPPLTPILGSLNWDIILLPVIICTLLLLLLLSMSALVSGSEVAFFSLSPTDKEELASKKTKASNVALELLERPKKLLATILIANNFINVAIIMIASYLSTVLFPPESMEVWLKFLIDVVAITFILLLFGEVIPKIYATKHGTQLSLLMAVPLRVVGKTFPFNVLSRGLVKGTAVISNLGKKKSVDVSSDELSHAVELTMQEEDDPEDHKILEGIVKFGNKDVKQIMKSRIDVQAIEYSIPYDEVYQLILESRYSRIPVYKESFDEIAGILFIKDLLTHLDEDKNFEWQKLIREPYFVPENKKIDDLLGSFQEKKMHMAIVVDEYGGTSGIVTLEDVLEEIVGDISDEFDDEDLVYSKLDENNYVFEGKTPLVDMYKVLNIEGNEFEDAKSESDTLAGFVIEQAGKILLKNEKVNFGIYTFTIEAADRRKVKRIKVTINKVKEEIGDVETE